MDKILIEVCSFSFEGCITAQYAGADRIELCANPAEGGTTPSYGLIKKVSENLGIDVFPIIRPRGGDFCYSPDEFEIMLQDIKMCKDLKCKGIATGIQKQDGTIDTERFKIIVETAWPMEVTCVRVIDIVPDPFKAIDNVIAAGCKRILTSGMASTAVKGIETIRKMVEYANKRITIMPGSGVRPENIISLIEQSWAREFHTSARFFEPNTAIWTNKEITEKDFGSKVNCDFSQIAEMRKLSNIFIQMLNQKNN
jgi:copper homeostasis protein